MQLYSYKDYKQFLRDTCNARKAGDPTFSYARMAVQAKVQRSYLSHVLNGEAHLNADQLFEAGRFLRLGDEELDYLLLLLDAERCQSPERRRRLESRRQRVQAVKLSSEAALKREPSAVEATHMTAYYADPFCSLAHMYLTIPRFLANPPLVQKQLGISNERFATILDVLEQMKILVLKKKGGYELKVATLHLPEGSVLARTHGSFMRLKGIERRQSGGATSDHFFSATFSGTEALKLEIKAMFMDFLAAAAEKIEDEPAEDVYHLNFDLFGF